MADIIMRIIIIMNIIMNLYSLPVYLFRIFFLIKNFNCIGNVTGKIAHARTVSSRPTIQEAVEEASKSGANITCSSSLLLITCNQ